MFGLTNHSGESFNTPDTNDDFPNKQLEGFVSILQIQTIWSNGNSDVPPAAPGSRALVRVRAWCCAARRCCPLRGAGADGLPLQRQVQRPLSKMKYMEKSMRTYTMHKEHFETFGWVTLTP